MLQIRYNVLHQNKSKNRQKITYGITLLFQKQFSVGIPGELVVESILEFPSCYKHVIFWGNESVSDQELFVTKVGRTRYEQLN